MNHASGYKPNSTNFKELVIGMVTLGKRNKDDY